jgi:hypothetical protein
MRPTPRALAIAEGLVRTGRATPAEESENHLVLACKAGGYYWITFDGKNVSRGPAYAVADKLQSGFIAAMERAGAPVQGRPR